MKRPDDDMTGTGAIVFLVLIALCCVGDCWWNSYAYGDWTCAFKRCVQVKEMK